MIGGINDRGASAQESQAEKTVRIVPDCSLVAERTVGVPKPLLNMPRQNSRA
jgi:hypothetical protein